MSDLIVDAHDVVESESHPTSSPPLQRTSSSTLTQHHHVGEVDVGDCSWSAPCGHTCEDQFGNSSMFLHRPCGLQRSQAKQNNTQRVANSWSLWHEFMSRRSSPYKFVDVLSLELLLIETTRGPHAAIESMCTYTQQRPSKVCVCVIGDHIIKDMSILVNNTISTTQV
jgi:hypothetical protein